MKLLGNIQDNKDIINKEYVKDMVISSDDSIDDVLTVTSAEFDAMLQAGTLDPNTLYNVTDGPEQDKVVYNTVPVGTGVLWFGDLESVPDNFIVPDGSIVNISDYPDLFAIWGTKYGGNGTTTFGLPDLKGRVVVMMDQNDTDFDTVGETGGEKTHTLTSTEMPSHTHTQSSCTNSGNHQHYMYSGYVTYKAGTATNASSPATGSAKDWGGDQYTGASGDHTHTITLNNTGGDEAHNNVQPYIVAYYIIKAKKGIYTESLRRLDSEVSQMKKNMYVYEAAVTLPSGQTEVSYHVDLPNGFSKTNCVILSAMISGGYKTTVTECPEATAHWSFHDEHVQDIYGGGILQANLVVSLADMFTYNDDYLFISYAVKTAPSADVRYFIRITLFKFR